MLLKGPDNYVYEPDILSLLPRFQRTKLVRNKQSILLLNIVKLEMTQYLVIPSLLKRIISWLRGDRSEERTRHNEQNLNKRCIREKKRKF